MHEGEAVALLGRNGAGKTTTLRAIAGTMERVEGYVGLGGHNLVGDPPFAVAARGVAWVPQDRRIFPGLTAHENLELAWRMARRREPFTLTRVYSLFPELDRLRYRKGAHLSGGEQRLVSLARALVQNPVVMLLDEPTEGLSPVLAARLLELLQTLRREGVTMLLAEQNVRFASRLCERAYVMDKGRIQSEGTMKELLEDAEAIGRYLSL